VTRRHPRAPDPSPLERQLEQLHARSYGWALSCCGWDADEAADVVQAAYLKILDGRARFEGRSELSTWLFGVIRVTASEHRRVRLRRRLLLARHAPEQTVTRDDAVAGFHDARMLHDALDALPRRQREVLHLVFYGELTIREAAEVMGVGIGTARVHYERGKKRLRASLTEQEEG